MDAMGAMGPMATTASAGAPGSASAVLGLAERLGVALLIAAAALLRGFDLAAPFDRGFDGFQGAFFAIGAINYERLTIGASGGYPVENVENRRGERQSWYVYPNHPPTVPLIAWAALEAFAGEDWNAAWREDRSPQGIEGTLRFPFFVAGLIGLWALWWTAREAAGARVAMLALAVAALAPLGILYGGLVNYELPVLAPVVLGAGAAARWMRTGARSWLGLAALLFAAGGLVTYAALCFVPPLALWAWTRRGASGALALGAALGFAALAPLAAHGLWAAHVLGDLGRPSAPLAERALALWSPAFDGSMPIGEWLGRNGERIARHSSLGAGLAAVLGLGVALAPRAARPPGAGLALALLAGGLAAMLAFYRHSFEEQTPFLLLVGPGIAVLAALGLAALADFAAGLLHRPRHAGVAAVLLAGVIGIFECRTATELRHAWREPGPNDDPPGALGPELPMPEQCGREIAAVLEPGAVGLYPAALGFTPAVSFYAWRSLFPIDAASPMASVPLIEELGLAAAPRYLLLPRRPPSAAVPAVDALRALAQDVAAPTVTSERWEAWRLDR
jgi:hypothetical protein